MHPSEQSDRLPVSAILPVLNCAHRLKAHLEKAMEWLPQVSEIIVVDSHSSDGTLDVIHERLGGFAPKIVQHPRGLYASWNRGVRQATSPFVYFSTIGDSIDLQGLRELVGEARRHRADVVISPPRFEYEGDPSKYGTNDRRWPIHEIVDRLGLEEPQLVDPRVLYDFVLVYLERAILGSSASNLYRRAVLRRFPFSDEFLSAGDSAWFIQHNFDVRTVIHPKPLASYLFHEKDWSYTPEEERRSNSLRHSFAYRAFHRSLEHSPKLDANIARDLGALVNRVFRHAEDGQVAIDTADFALFEAALNQQSKDARELVHQLEAITTRIHYLKVREKERQRKRRFGPLRFAFPSAWLDRAARRRCKAQLDVLARSLTADTRSS